MTCSILKLSGKLLVAKPNKSFNWTGFTKVSSWQHNTLLHAGTATEIVDDDADVANVAAATLQLPVHCPN